MSRVALIMGGPSAEREVSLVSGKACAEALRAKGHEVTEIDFQRDVAALLKALDPAPDAVFNALHGPYGEDGCIQGLLEILGIPYTHSGVLASALAMDKPAAKKVFTASGLTCPDGRVVSRQEVLAGDVMDRPYVVKPLHEGSSVGVIIVREGSNELARLAQDWTFGEEVLVEPFIEGRELTVAVMGDRALAVTELRTKEGFYDYTAKYTEGKTEHIVPAPVHEKTYQAALDAALRAHQVIGCRGVTRADFRYDDTEGEPGELYLLEINTQPGMTPLSLVPEQARHLGISFEDLVDWMLEDAR